MSYAAIHNMNPTAPVTEQGPARSANNYGNCVALGE